MKIIDAHAHCFETLAGFGAEGEFRAIGGGKARWADGRTQQVIPPGYGDRAFPIESLLRMMDANGIQKAVLLQGGMLGFENGYMQEVRLSHRDRIRAAATVDPYCRKAEEICRHLLDDEGFRIFKFEVSSGCGLMGCHPDFDIANERCMRLYRMVADRGGMLAFDIGGNEDPAHQPKSVRKISDTFPEMPIVVCHLASPAKGQEDNLKRDLSLLRKDTVFFDLAALFWKIRPEEYPFPTAQACVKIAKEIVGAEHLMWGSDAPSTTVKLPMDKQIAYIADCLDPDEKEKVFWETAEKLYFS